MSKWFTIKNVGPAVGEIRLRGIIGYSKEKTEGWFGTYEGEAGTVKEFEEELRALGDIGTLNLYISSEGGIVSDGLAIHNILQRHQARIIAHIDGYAFSIATVIAMAADEIRMPSNALLMIHNASTYGGGDYRDFEREAEALKVHNQAIRRAYASKSGRDEKEFIPLMDATTYLDGPAAKALGLADTLTDEIALSNLSLNPRIKNSAEFAKLPPHIAARFDIPAPVTRPSSEPTPDPMNKAILALASLVGVALKGDETEDQMVAAIEARKEANKQNIGKIAAEHKIELNFEDPETKAHFDGLVTNATKPLQAKIEALEALIKNGAAGAAGAGSPVPGSGIGGGTSTKEQEIQALQDQLEAATDSKERGRLAMQIKNRRAAA